ncbi:MAG: hypothetical protein ACLR9W_02530 [Enterobacter hormaechei]
MMLNLQRNLPQNVTQAQLSGAGMAHTQLLEPKFRLHRMRRMRIWWPVKALINQQPLSTRVYGRLKRLLEHDENLKRFRFLISAAAGGWCFRAKAASRW